MAFSFDHVYEVDIDESLAVQASEATRTQSTWMSSWVYVSDDS